MTGNDWLLGDIRENREEKKKTRIRERSSFIHQKYRGTSGGKNKDGRGKRFFIYISWCFIYRSISWINALVMVG